MSESSEKKMRLAQNLPVDVVEYMSSCFLPIESALRNRVVSTTFKRREIRCRNLDFSEVYSKRRYKKEVVCLVDCIVKQHAGANIDRFVLLLNHLGVTDKIDSWIKACIGKNIEELMLDFSKAKKVIDIPIDFSAIETLTVLKLWWCEFKMPNNSPKGLKHLRTLSLMRSKVSKEMIEAIFKNCIYFESLELIRCPMFGILNINARNHKSFKSLSVSFMPKLLDIILDAPTMECYKYEGHVRLVDFSSVLALKEANLNYVRSFDWHYYNPYVKVLSNLAHFTCVHVLKTTNIFLEALSYTYSDGTMNKPVYWFWNLKEFHVAFKAPSVCTLFSIAEFLDQCPNVEKVVIDINGFTFEPESYWILHQKPKIQSHDYQLKTIKFVDIKGYKNHSHELDIIEFFIKNAKSLEEINLKAPKNPKVKLYEPDIARINYIKSISPRKGLIRFSG